MKEEVIVGCGWKRTRARYKLWVKAHPRVFGEGECYEDAENELRDAIGAELNIVTACFEFDPPLPKSKLQAEFTTPELYGFVGGCNRFEVPRQKHRHDLEAALQNADSFFQNPVCRRCYSPTGPRSERPLVVQYVDSADDAAFGGVASVWLSSVGNVHIFSERFLDALTAEEAKRLQFRQVERTKRSRIRFYELLGPPGPSRVGISGLRADGWYCGACGYRCFGYHVTDLNIIDFVAKRDLPELLPGLFSIGTPPHGVELCGTPDRWRKLLRKGVRGVGTRLLGVVSNSRLDRLPKLKRRSR